MQFKDLEYSTKVILKIVLVVLVLAFLWVIRDVLLILVLAVIFASAMEPMVDYLKIKKIPRAVSVLAVYVLVLGLVTLVISSVVPLVIEQLAILEANLPQLLSAVESRVGNLALIFGGAGAATALQGFFSEGTGTTVFSRTVGVFNGFFTFVTVLVISFYLVAQEKGMKELLRTLVPAPKQAFALQLVSKIQKKMGLWVLGQLILSLSIFAVTFIALTILGVKYALVLALLAGLLEVIPYIGPTISAIPAVGFALIQNPPLAIAVIVLYILIQKLEGYILVPKIMEKTVGMSPLVVLLSLLIGFKLAGIVGLLISVPIAGAITTVIQEFSGASGEAKDES